MTGTKLCAPSQTELEAMAKRRHQNPTPYVRGNWWVIDYRVDEFRNGETCRLKKQERLADKKVNFRRVLELRDDFMRPLNQGLSLAGAGMPFADYVNQVYRVTKLPLFEGSSQARYKSVISNYLLKAFGKVMLREIKKETVQSFFTELAVKTDLSLASRKKIWTVLSSIMSTANDFQYLRSNPATGIDLGRDRGGRTKHFISPEQFNALVALMLEPYATMVYVAVLTGLRFSELAGLKWKNVHIEERSITINERFCRGNWGAPKSESSNATIKVARSAIERIQSLKQATTTVRAGNATRTFQAVKSSGPDDLVFQSVQDGCPMRDNNILRRHIKPAAEKLGIPWVNWQCLRRSCATWHKKAGTHIRDAQALMRHKHSSTTLGIYMQTDDDTQLGAVDAMETFAQASKMVQ